MPTSFDTTINLVSLGSVAAVAGAINSVAGGGTLLTFPALIAALGGTAEAAVIANATSTVALFPGSLAGMAGYRRELRLARSWIKLLLLPSLLGGLIGSMLLMRLPAESFKALVPWLILTAALLFWLQPRLARRLGMRAGDNADRPQHVALASLFQFLVAIYGGYFGAGIGILMLTALALMGLHDIHQMNGLKTLFGSAINGVAVAVFVASGKVDWTFALAMALAAMAGGYGGAHVARRLDRNFVRRLVIFIGLALGGYYLYQQWAVAPATTTSAEAAPVQATTDQLVLCQSCYEELQTVAGAELAAIDAVQTNTRCRPAMPRSRAPGASPRIECFRTGMRLSRGSALATRIHQSRIDRALERPLRQAPARRGATIWSAAIHRRFGLRLSRLCFDASGSDQQPVSRKKARSATDECGDESPHSKGWHRCAADSAFCAG